MNEQNTGPTFIEMVWGSAFGSRRGVGEVLGQGQLEPSTLGMVMASDIFNAWNNNGWNQMAFSVSSKRSRNNGGWQRLFVSDASSDIANPTAELEHHTDDYSESDEGENEDIGHDIRMQHFFDRMTQTSMDVAPGIE